MKKVVIILALTLVMLITSGCFWQTGIGENQVGLILQDGSSISEVVRTGRYSRGGFYSRMVVIDCSTITVEWTPAQAELVTKDKQPIGMTVSVSARRMCDSDSIKKMYAEYNPEAISNDALISLIMSRIPRSGKEVSPQATLDEMLGIASGDSAGRSVLTNRFSSLLSPELAEFYVELVDVGINNIDPSDSYIALLQRKADAQVAVEVAQEEGRLAEENLNKERLQTEVELELARRENLINSELAKTYEQSPEYFRLEELRLLAEVVGENDKFWFVPEGSDITLFLGGGTGSQPVPVSPGN